MPGNIIGVGVKEDKLDLASAQAYWTDSGPMQKLQATPDCLGLNVPTRSDECELATQHSMNMGLELQSSGLPTAIRISKLHLFNHADGIDARAACSVHRSSNTGRIGSSERATLLLSPSSFSVPPVSKNTFLWDVRGQTSVYGTKLLCTVYYRRP